MVSRKQSKQLFYKSVFTSSKQDADPVAFLGFPKLTNHELQTPRNCFNRAVAFDDFTTDFDFVPEINSEGFSRSFYLQLLSDSDTIFNSVSDT